MNNIGEDHEVTTEQWKYITKMVYYAADPISRGREIIGMNKTAIGWGKEQYAYNSVTNPAEAIVSMTIEDHRDTVNIAQ